MKTISILIVLLGFTLSINAQSDESTGDYDREILKVKQILDDGNYLDSLADQMITNSNLLYAYSEEIEQNEENIKQQKRKWLSSFRVGINLYSSNTTLDENQESITTLGFLPNTGVTLAIDPERLINRNSYIRQAQHQRNMSEARYLDQKRQLKNWITSEYYKYLQALEAIVLRAEMVQIREQQYSFLEYKFEQGQTDLQAVLVAQSSLTQAKEGLMEAKIAAMSFKSSIETSIEPINQ